MLTATSPTPPVENETRSPTDHELVAELNAGNTAAFDLLYERHCDWVAGLAFRFTRDRDASLDVLQETFLYFARKFPGFTLTCQLRSFLYPVVRNIALSAGRKTARFTSADAMLEAGALSEPAAPEAGATTTDDLTAVLVGLSADHREVLVLRFVDGFELREIAEALDLPVGTVKSRLHHALAQLRKSPRTRKYFEDC